MFVCTQMLTKDCDSFFYVARMDIHQGTFIYQIWNLPPRRFCVGSQLESRNPYLRLEYLCFRMTKHTFVNDITVP